MKHSSHPLHSRKVKELHNELNFNFLQEINKKRSIKKQQITSTKAIDSEQKSLKKRSQGQENLSKLEGRYMTGGKKRM